jgi:hypothetical protein
MAQPTKPEKLSTNWYGKHGTEKYTGKSYSFIGNLVTSFKNSLRENIIKVRKVTPKGVYKKEMEATPFFEGARLETLPRFLDI